MKLINQSAEYLPQQGGLDGIYKQIELAGRTAYLSQDKITEGSAKKFVGMLIKSGHTSVLEHGTVYLDMPMDLPMEHDEGWAKYDNDHFSKVAFAETGHMAVTTNLRVLQEHGWLDDLQYLCEPTEFHEKRLSVRVITDIGIAREFNRHRNFSITEQSTRYCNYAKEKFGKEITFIKPYWWDQFNQHVDNEGYREDGTTDMYSSMEFWDCLVNTDCNYMAAIEAGMQPQQARAILPLCTKTEAVYTAFESDWRYFFDLRLFGKTGEPHPQIKALTELVKEEFKKYGLWKGIMEQPTKFN